MPSSSSHFICATNNCFPCLQLCSLNTVWAICNAFKDLLIVLEFLLVRNNQPFSRGPCHVQPKETRRSKMCFTQPCWKIPLNHQCIQTVRASFHIYPPLPNCLQSWNIPPQNWWSLPEICLQCCLVRCLPQTASDITMTPAKRYWGQFLPLPNNTKQARNHVKDTSWKL